MTEIIISLEALSDISGKDIKLSKYDEVVTRCKDCIYHRGVWCTKNSYREFDPNDVVTGDDDYCSMAKRKEE